jgi:cobyrinic acid a,c-diamide synthase
LPVPLASPLQPFPRIVLSASCSDAGKTTIAIGLIAALSRRGLTVSAAKVGPDFIDAAHLARASGAAARNLDAWLAPEAAVLDAFVRGAGRADISIVEGVMGLFDGRHGSGDGSTAHTARLLDAPIVLVLDCAKASSTVGAIAYGLARYDPRLRVAGAILNRTASPRHAATVRDACAAAGVPVLGVIPRDARLELPSRHLGLTGPQETGWAAFRDAAADAVQDNVDLDALLELAGSAPALSPPQRAAASQVAARIAIARDEAFWFYDESSLDALRDAGAELVPYSPLRDAFPRVDAAFIGGGYPELHAAALEANATAREGLREAIAAGMPVYAECGGLMYLSSALRTGDRTHAMVGAVPATSTMSDRRSALRYVEARVLRDGPLFGSGESVRGHEFHYSLTAYDRSAPAYAIDGVDEGYVDEALHASYVHVHLGGRPAAAHRFIARARAFGGRR